MAYSLLQKDKCLFHITHIKNIPSILRNSLLCKAQVQARRIQIQDVSHENIQAVRSIITIPETHHSLHDCVPMFFGARPPMLYAQKGKGIEQANIVYVLVRWDIIGNPNVWFTDGNARSFGTSFYKNLSDLSNIDFSAAGAVYWADKGDEYKRKKQAEVLKLNNVELNEVLGFAVATDDVKERVAQMLSAQGIDKKVHQAPEFYFL